MYNRGSLASIIKPLLAREGSGSSVHNIELKFIFCEVKV